MSKTEESFELFDPRKGGIPPSVEVLVTWIVQHCECESALLQPEPQHYIFCTPLLDTICEVWGIDKQRMGGFVDEIRDSQEGGE